LCSTKLTSSHTWNIIKNVTPSSLYIINVTDFAVYLCNLILVDRTSVYDIKTVQVSDMPYAPCISIIHRECIIYIIANIINRQHHHIATLPRRRGKVAGERKWEKPSGNPSLRPRHCAWNIKLLMRGSVEKGFRGNYRLKTKGRWTCAAPKTMCNYRSTWRN